ncbi:polysaccharide deacetylase family protein [Candidatus Pacearchaeota archaeon]|nr:polysaccharide deacetylase family protein [Candidatus Pacearchaeota archaeon]
MIAITIDCEQWNAPALRGKKDPSNDNTSYSLDGNEKLLKILDNNKVMATFFVTGFFAEKEGEQIRKIAKKHEIACHGYNHFYRGNENLNLLNDISKAKKILEKTIKRGIIGFRAPQVQFSKELIKILEKLNFKYDSSIHSAWLPGFYNHRDKPLKPFKIGKILEIPASASSKLRLPFSWIFIRNLPLIYSVNIVKRLLKNGIIPVIYLHSWEFYPVKNKSVAGYITRNTGDKFCRKFDKFLRAFKNEKFVTMVGIYRDFKDNQ